MYEIYTTWPHLEILIVEGLCPRARSTPRAVKEEKRDTISFRPAGRPTEPFLSRNYEIASLKDPLRAVDSLYFLFPHRRRYPSSSSSLEIVPPPPVSRTPFSLGVIAKSATHYPILPLGFLPPPSLFLSHCIEHPSSYSPRVFIPDRFVLLPVATPRDRPRLAQVTAIGNFNARPVLPNDFIQRNGCRGVASTIDAQTRDRHSTLVYLRALLLSPTSHPVLLFAET